MKRAILAFLVLSIGLFGPASSTFSQEREQCTDYQPLRQPLFGDLHIHTRYSHDAASQGTRARPIDAYRFAKGETLAIQPWDEDGNALRTLRLERPLDFAGVSDHAELFGEIKICNTPGLEGHDSFVCRVYRGWPKIGALLVAGHGSARADRYGFCGDEGGNCLAAARSVWEDTQKAAEATYDRAPTCQFTTLIGYEWTAVVLPQAGNLHRNIFFRGSAVPETPVDSIDFFPAEAMWDELDVRCKPEEGCEWVSIPHNSNISAEQLFRTTMPDGSALTRETAARRGAAERIVEIFQHKGSSECAAALSPNDELCGFENLPYQSFGEMKRGQRSEPGPLNFVRNVLGEGLVQQAALGANPFAFGILASTDTHLGAAGAVSESGYPGHGGANDAVAEVTTGLVDLPDFNPGGLAVVWAEENSRDAIFDAFQRREVYGTSGPRIALRFFGGPDYGEEMCHDADAITRAYREGVPMGSDLPAASQKAPHFFVSATQDVGTASTPGTPLERLQIIKVWERDGASFERVFDIATATPEKGAALCAVWEDPEFDPARHAAYYARAVEQPTLRWHARICERQKVSCDAPDALPDNLRGCCEGRPDTVQERAWSSPIWYTPSAP